MAAAWDENRGSRNGEEGPDYDARCPDVAAGRKVVSPSAQQAEGERSLVPVQRAVEHVVLLAAVAAAVWAQSELAVLGVELPKSWRSYSSLLSSPSFESPLNYALSDTDDSGGR